LGNSFGGLGRFAAGHSESVVEGLGAQRFWLVLYFKHGRRRARRALLLFRLKMETLFYISSNIFVLPSAMLRTGFVFFVD